MIDFLVVGGGIAGTSVGARLSQLGEVVLLEEEDALGYHASGRSAALYEETYGLPSTLALNRASKRYHMEANGGVLSPRGLMLIGTAVTAAPFAEDFAKMQMERLTLEEARGLVPILDPKVVTEIGYRAEAWDIDTDRLLQNFAKKIRANGGRVETRAHVRRITKDRAGWTVETPDGEYAARTLVNAAGAWVDHIAHLAGVRPLGFQPLRRSMARIPAPGGCDLSGWPMMFGPGEDWYAKPDAGKLIVSPAEEDPCEPHDAWADDMVLAEGLARYEAVMTEAVTRVESSWAGLRTFAPDRCLVIGFDPQVPGFFWHAGQGGYGFQTAPAASALAADLVAGRASELAADVIAQLSPARFG